MSRFSNTHAYLLLLMLGLAIAATALFSSMSSGAFAGVSNTGSAAESGDLYGQRQKTIRLAKTFKYEVPNAVRAPPPSAPAPTVRTPSRSTPAPTFVPSTRGTTQSAPSGGGGGGPTIRVGPFGLSIGGGGGGGGGSCEGCRESCYNRLHGTKKFSPCMKGCWNKYCRR